MELPKMNQYQDDEGGMDLGALQQGSFANPMAQNPGTILDLTSTEELLSRLEANLCGEMLDDQGKRIKVGEPLCNKDGVKSIIGIVRSAGSQSSVMSDFEMNEVKIIMEYLNDALCHDLMLNRYFYDIRNPAARKTITFMANSCCFAILKRGFEGGERRFWKGSQQEFTFKGGESGQKKGGGFFSGLVKR